MLYIVIKHNSIYRDLILAPLVERGIVRLIPFNDRRGGFMLRILREIYLRCPLSRPLLQNAVFSKEVVRDVKQIGENDNVILFDIWNLKCQRALRILIGRRRVDSFIWDNVSAFYSRSEIDPRYVDTERRYGLRMHTFDPGDAERYGFTLVPQIHCRMAETPAERETDVFYVGRCFNRADALAQLIEQLQREKVDHLITIPGESDHPVLKPYMTPDAMSYEQILEMNRKCSCIAEILKEGQTGFTLRTLEALFMGKKLITNNREIASAPFYNKANIYILGAEPERTISEFLKEPMVKIPEDIKERYDVEHWIEPYLKRNEQ